jgi:hypothetical protein
MNVGGRTICLTFEEKEEKKAGRDCKIYFPAGGSQKQSPRPIQLSVTRLDAYWKRLWSEGKVQTNQTRAEM